MERKVTSRVQQVSSVQPLRAAVAGDELWEDVENLENTVEVASVAQVVEAGVASDVGAREGVGQPDLDVTLGR